MHLSTHRRCVRRVTDREPVAFEDRTHVIIMRRLSTTEWLAARERLAAEKLHPVRSVSHLLNATPESLIRFALRGKRGIRLDAVLQPDGWYTSVEAIERFRLALLANATA